MADADTQRSAPLSALITGAAALARGADLDAALGELVGTAAAAVGAANVAISLQDPDRPTPELTFTVGLDEAAQAALTEAVAAPDHPLTAAAVERRETNGGGIVALPLVVGRAGIEQALGAISFGFALTHVPTDDDLAFLRGVADLAAVAVDRSRLASTASERSEWFERLAHTDPLTGLANMRTFSRVLELELARAGRQKSEVSVAVFDLDDFGSANDAAGGHEAGDQILRSVAAVIAGAVRLVDTVARLGGDEFIVVAPGSAGMTVARRVLEGVDELPPVDGRPIRVSAGVARFPVDGTDSETIIAAARATAGRARTEGSGSLEATPG